ncbi:MAG: hypothetical protein H6834_17860 [Planctomycetes bacterium]|nr:hypothetical protein [Planctomycetota bacterium]
MFKKTILTVVACGLAAFVVGCGGDDKGGNGGGNGGGPNTSTKAGKPIDAGKTGNATITVKYSGTTPEVSFFDTTGNADCNAATGGQLAKELLVVNGNATVANALVYVSKGHEEWEVPAAPKDKVVLDQHNCRYNPHSVALRVGQQLDITNSDPFAHNVHGMPAKNKPEFNQQQGGKGQGTLTKSFRRPEVGLFVKCDVHSWMSAYVHVMDHPWFDITGETGTVTLKGLPEGKYTVSVWQEKQNGEKSVQIEIKAGQTTTAEVTL